MTFLAFSYISIPRHLAEYCSFLEKFVSGRLGDAVD